MPIKVVILVKECVIYKNTQQSVIDKSLSHTVHIGSVRGTDRDKQEKQFYYMSIVKAKLRAENTS